MSSKLFSPITFRGLTLQNRIVVSPEGRITWGDLGLYSDANERALGRELEEVLQFSEMPLAIQLGHAGRKASSEKPWLGGQLLAPDDPHGWPAVAPSALPVAADELPPAALTHARRTCTAVFSNLGMSLENLGGDGA